MSNEIDKQYARNIMPRMRMATLESTHPFKINMRCPICGDSAKDKTKKRGWIYEGSRGNTKGVLLFNCFNCNNNGRGAMPLSALIEELYPDLYSEYKLDILKGTPSYHSMIPKQENAETEFVENADTKKVEAISNETLNSFSLYTKIIDLPITHPVRRYIAKREIPVKYWDILGFTPSWYTFVNTFLPDQFNEYALKHDHPRLVIPILTKDGMVAVQGRALSKDRLPRYQTIKIDDSFDKIYGLERVDPQEPVIYFEGPLDSLFIDNALALTGGYLNASEVPFADNRIWALDNEPRHKDTLKRMQKLIKEGERVTIWDKLPFTISQYKDINDMVMKGSAKRDFLKKYIIENSPRGLDAELRFSQWKKINI